MSTPNYKQVEMLLASHESFTHGHSMSARWEQGKYVVLSYRTPIGEFDPISRVWWINPQRYSQTTSKQQNMLRRIAQKESE